jgi:hypothetical protein
MFFSHFSFDFTQVNGDLQIIGGLQKTHYFGHSFDVCLLLRLAVIAIHHKHHIPAPDDYVGNCGGE